MKRALALSILAAALITMAGCRGRARPAERAPGARTPASGAAGVLRRVPTPPPPAAVPGRPTPRRPLPD